MNLEKLINGRSRFSEIIRFGIVGGIATLLHIGLYFVFLHTVGVKPVIATIISYAISFAFNSFLSSYFTFHSSPNAKKGLGFTLSHLFNMGMQTGLVAIFAKVIGPSLAILPAIAISFPINYLLVRFAFTAKIFKGSSEKSEKPDF